jgi:hypothetical protein
MMVLAVLSIAMGVVFYAFTASMRIFTSEISEADASLQAHKAIERMSSELQGALQIVSASATSITFWYSDTNGDGTREANETVTYTWTGTAEGYINRTVQASTLEIATGVKRLNLTYNDPSPPNINIIDILITVQKGTVLSTLESGVDIRNL